MGTDMNWTQPVCTPCWPRLQAGPPNEDVRLKEEYRDTETCCLCGNETRDGLYARLDPLRVPHPKG